MRFQVWRPFFRVIGGAVTRLSSKQKTPGQHRHGAPLWAGDVRQGESSAGHLRCPVLRFMSRPDLFSSTPFVVSSVSTRPCEGRGAGANPAKGTIFNNHHHAQGNGDQPLGCNPKLPGAPAMPRSAALWKRKAHSAETERSAVNPGCMSILNSRAACSSNSESIRL